MPVQFINDGATIKIITDEYTRNVQKDSVKINVDGDRISIRADRFGDGYKYSDVSAPVSTSIDNLRFILESWLEVSGGGGGVVIDPSQLDAAGRLPVALPVVLADYKFINSILAESMNTETNGTGSVTHDATTNSANLTTGANADYGIIQSYQWHPYFNGKAQIPEFTFINLVPETNVEKRIGYYSSATTGSFNTSYDGMWLRSDGTTVYFEIYRNGTEVVSVAQADWDDPLDGTGISGITVNWSNFQVVFFDFLYLGGTACKFYMVLNGVPKLIHTYVHANTVANTIIGTPAQPIRAEIRQTGAGSGTFKFVCAQVTSDGDANQVVGFPVGLQSGDARIGLSSAGVHYVMIAIRLKTGYRDLAVFQEVVNTLVSSGANETFGWELRLNPTLDAGAYSWSDSSIVGLEFSVGDGTDAINQDGYLISCGGGSTRSSIEGAISKLRRIGTAIDGTADILVLAMIPHDANQNAHASLNVNVL